ncbi:TPA: hypothetical protein ACN1MO_002029 [Enterococcus faecalis]
MRLREIQKIIEDNLPNLYDIEFEYVSGSGFRTTKYSEVFISILNLEKLGFIDPQYDKLINRNLLVNSTRNESVLFSQEKRNVFIEIIDQIIYKCQACLTLIKQNLHSESEDESSLIISMPDRNLTFSEFSELIKTLNDTLKLLQIIPEFQSDINLSNFDVGSKWLVLSF